MTLGRAQEIAARLGLSETVVLDVAPTDPERVARLRIFTPAVELPFAGHPTVGAAWWLASRGTPAVALDVPAGRVDVRHEGGIALVTARPEWAPDFTVRELGSGAEVDALDPDEFASGPHYLWAWLGEGEIRARMFAPAFGIREDEATGAAAVAVTGSLGRGLTIRQGAGSVLATRLLADGRVEL
ncbi:MAG TPA: PhzF family phenazine biosynthesis protein, partial [Actinotalea sp.]|nr:PhzF family phenazine biosynthesis protein [Actinotalea sp.]